MSSTADIQHVIPWPAESYIHEIRHGQSDHAINAALFAETHQTPAVPQRRPDAALTMEEEHARKSAERFGPYNGWLNFQPLYQSIVKEQPDLLSASQSSTRSVQ